MILLCSELEVAQNVKRYSDFFERSVSNELK